MKLPLNGRAILVYVFIITAIASSVGFVLAARDYQLMYQSLNQLQFTVASVSLEQPSAQDLLIGFRCDNPVDYSGLRATQVYVSLYFLASGHALFQNNTLNQYFIINQPVAPAGGTMWSNKLFLNLANYNSTANFKAAYGNVIADITMRVIVDSFLSQVTSTGSGYDQQQNVTLT